MVKFFSPHPWQMMTFLNPLDALIQETAIFIFAGSPAGPGCQFWQDFGGAGGLAQGLGIRLFAFGGAYWPLATASFRGWGGGVGQRTVSTPSEVESPPTPACWMPHVL